MRELAPLTLPEVQVMFHVKHDWKQQAQKGEKVSRETSKPAVTNLLLAGGRASLKEWLQAAGSGKAVYCADRGASYALEAGLSPALVVGDCDSTSKATYVQAQSLGAMLDIHPPAKDDTDLQLLLAQMPEGNLLATGIWGGRFDHLFSNVYSLLAFKEQRQCQVVLADEEEFMVLLTTEETVEIELTDLAKVQAISLLPLAEQSCVSITGVRWPLERAQLSQQRPYAISNDPLASFISCTCHSGKIGLYIHWQV